MNCTFDKHVRAGMAHYVLQVAGHCCVCLTVCEN